MKVLNKIVLGLAMPLMLTGCLDILGGGYNEVSREEFFEAAVEAFPEESPYKKVTCNGKVVSEGETTTFKNIEVGFDDDWEPSEDEETYAKQYTVAMLITFINAPTISSEEPEDEFDVHWYIKKDNKGFKVSEKADGEQLELLFEEYGLLSSYVGKSSTSDVNLKFVYTK